MAKKIISRPSIFGWTNHYDKNGKKIGHSRKGLFGNTIHYDEKGHRVGY